MNRKNTKEGISLIVLVITIIVMIILAGAIIISLTNGNVISKAKLAKESNDFVGIREMIEMENSNAMFPGSTFNTANVPIPTAYANDIEIKVGATNVATIVLKYNASTKITDIQNAIDKLGAVYIPNGFTYLTGEKDTGLVIKDTTTIVNNEYVWIPVEGTLERKAFFQENLLTEYNEDITGIYNSMKTSVEKYNGFYVSRYEAGNDIQAPLNDLAIDGSRKPLSQKDKFAWTWIPFASSGNADTSSGAAKVAKLAYTNELGVDNIYVGSSLLYGAQYDAMLSFIQTGSQNILDSRSWGNHCDSTFMINSSNAKQSFDWGIEYSSVSSGTTVPINSYRIMTTGASEQNKAKNIYDLAGNVMEWTYEKDPVYSGRVIRSGSFLLPGSSYSAASRFGESPSSALDDCGFRFALYIK